MTLKMTPNSLLNLASRRTDGWRGVCAHVPRGVVALADVTA